MILPHVKITELLLEVDEWTGFTRHFAHLKSGDLAKDKNLLLTTILADAINLGLTKMAESCPGTTYAKLAWLQAWHIRDETYGTALAELVNAQFRHPFAEHWGDGTTSSSDGQNFRTGSKAESTGHINPKYGSSPGRTFYTHLRPVRAVPHQGRERRRARLDLRARRPAVPRIRPAHRGALHRHGRLHRSRLRADAPAGLPLRAAHPRPGRHQALHPEGRCHLRGLKPMIGGTLNIKHVRAHWDEILRLATSIKQGGDGLADAQSSAATRARTAWPSPCASWGASSARCSSWTGCKASMRRRVHAGLNKRGAQRAGPRRVLQPWVKL
jgi:hypothetical protein